MHNPKGGIARRSRIINSAALNVAGQAIPALVALFAVRQILLGLGVDRFGILAIAWAAIGYASLFDLGTSRALTRLLASRAASGGEDTSALTWTALALMSGLGTLMSLLVVAAAPALAGVFTRSNPAMLEEVTTTVRLMALIVPVAILTTGSRGILEAQHRFGLINAIMVPGTLATYLVPAVVLGFSPKLPPVILGLIAVRVAVLVALLAVCFAKNPALANPRFDFHDVVPLLTFGGWASVTNFVGPAIVQADRILLAAVASLSALSYYTVPAEVIARLAIVPGAIAQVLFPVFSESAAQDHGRTSRLLGSGVKVLFAMLYPPTLVAVLLAPNALTIWLGADTSAHATGTARLLGLAFFVNALAYPPFALIHASGNPRVTATIHLLEFPAHVLIAWLLIRQFGAVGAALATTIRNAVDTVAMLLAAKRLVDGFGHVLRRLGLLALAAGVTFAVAASPAKLLARVVLSAGGMLLVMGLVWFWLLSGEERTSLKRLLLGFIMEKQRATPGRS